MAVQIESSLMASDKTVHQARHVGDNQWESSWLRGRKLSVEQAVAAMRVAEEAVHVMTCVESAVEGYVAELGRTPLEAVGMASSATCPWPPPRTLDLTPPSTRRWLRRSVRP